MITKNSTLHIRIPESELKASQDTAKALNMHHSEFVREAIKEKILLDYDAFDEKLGRV
jgi:predicted DNA binding CopG/RHH family protein